MSSLENERDAYRDEAERLRADAHRYLWNLAGCSTYALGYGLDDGHDESMAVPALNEVRALALREHEGRRIMRDLAEACARTSDYDLNQDLRAVVRRAQDWLERR